MAREDAKVTAQAVYVSSGLTVGGELDSDGHSVPRSESLSASPTGAASPGGSCYDEDTTGGYEDEIFQAEESDLESQAADELLKELSPGDGDDQDDDIDIFEHFKVN